MKEIRRERRSSKRVIAIFHESLSEMWIWGKMSWNSLRKNFPGIGYNLDRVEWINRRERKISVQSISQFSLSVVSDSLRPHGLQHTRLPCPSTTPGAYTNSCSLSWWCHPTISSSVIPFSSCLQSFPASGSFRMSHFFKSGAQSIGVSASASVLSINIQDWFPLRLTGSPCSPRDSQSLLQHHSSKASTLQCSAFFIVQLSHPYMTTGKNQSFN